MVGRIGEASGGEEERVITWFSFFSGVFFVPDRGLKNLSMVGREGEESLLWFIDFALRPRARSRRKPTPGLLRISRMSSSCVLVELGESNKTVRSGVSGVSADSKDVLLRGGGFSGFRSLDVGSVLRGPGGTSDGSSESLPDSSGE